MTVPSDTASRPDASSSQRLESALGLHRSGALQEAERLYREILAEEAGNIEALHLLGIARYQQGDAAAAVELLEQAIALRPGFAEAHNNLGNALYVQGEPARAAAAYRMAVKLNPALVDAHSNLGNALCLLGDLEQAAEAYGRAAELKPDLAEVQVNLGNTLSALGRLDEAIARYRLAIAVNPALFQAFSNLGNAYRVQGRLAEAVAALQEALRLAPDLAEAHNNLGNAFKEQGRLADAAGAYRKALALNPDLAETLSNLGNVLCEQGLLAEAMAAFKRSLQLWPDPGVHSNLLLNLGYDGNTQPQALFAAHREWAQRYAAPVTDEAVSAAVPRDSQRTLRIGYVSADFRRHPVGYFLLEVFAHHDPERCEIYCYSGCDNEDDLTARLRERANAWRSTLGLPDDELARTIHADGIDILVDLAGHTAGNRLTLFAHKPAPVQATWLGYCDTTGLPGMDYILMDEVTAPPDVEPWFTEKVVRLPDTRWCYAPPEYAPAVAAPPVQQRGFVTFGSFNNLIKLGPEVIDLWAGILRAVPDAHLLLNWRTLEDPALKARYQNLFAERGVEASRLELRGERVPHAEVLAAYADIDIALDLYPFTGGLSTCEALWMGVPVITRAGERPVSRQGKAILLTLGMEDLVAETEDDYVNIAVSLARDPRRIADLRAGLRQKMASSPLRDGATFTRNLEAVYRSLREAEHRFG
jgi:predicted O-linked N-acetylglucosamine transferase (SPINDLY family)